MHFYTLKRLVLIMKLTAILLFVIIVQASASSFAQKLNLDVRNSPLSAVFTIINEQTGYDFIYNDFDLASAKNVSLRLRDAPLQVVVDACMRGQDLTYVIKEKTIIIKRKTHNLLDHFRDFISADIQLNGLVITEDGSPISNVIVRIKGQKVLTTTNFNGEFFVKAPEGTVVEFVHLGFLSQEITLGKGSKSLTITLKQEISKLDEVAIEGYRKGSQRLATSNIAKVSSEELMKQPVGNPIQALEGRVAGLVVNQASGVPGARLNIQIRGRANFDSNLSSDQPLFIVDGVPMAAGNDKVNPTAGPFGVSTADGLSAFSGLNIADIESIDILKDADATAIYGSRGANGVVLITTRKGKAGKMKLEANVYSGVSTVTKMATMMNTQQYLTMRNEALANDNITKTNANAYDLLLWDPNRYTDFAKLLTGNNATTNDAQVTVSGGSKYAQYRLGTGYHREGTVWPGDESSDRGSLNFNLHSLSENERFTVDFSGLYSIGHSNLTAVDLASAVVLPPNYRLYDDKGNLSWNEGGYNDQRDNPLSQLNQVYHATMNNLNANMVLNYKVIRNLVLRSSFGYNSTQAEDQRLTPISAQNPSKAGLNGFTQSGTNNYKNWIVEPQMEYNGKVSKGKLNILLGATYNKRSTTNLSARGTGYTSDDLLKSLAAATTVTATNTATQYNYQAFFGRVNYNWQDRYIANFTGRRDGSSRFGPEYRFSNFGAVGAAWIFSNEKGLQKNKVLSYGKLRASYGITGNDQIGDYSYLDTYVSGGTYGDSATLAPAKLYNPALHWERNRKAEIGLELGFFKDRILTTVSVYQNMSSDPLVSYPLPKITGFATVVNNLNGVEVENRGLELTLSTRNLVKTSLQWTTDFNFTLPRNILKKYPNLSTSSYATTYAIGESLNRIYASQYLGVDPATGFYTVKDVNGDGKVSVLDYATLLNKDPKFYGGLNNIFSYKRFSASFFLQFTKQTGVQWTSNNNYNPPGTMYNVPAAALERWQAAGQQSDVQKFTTSAGAVTGLTGFYAYMLSNARFTNASFIRLKNVNFSYSLPSRWLNVVHVNAYRLYVSAQNLLVISPYKVGDPEVQNYTIMSPLRTVTGGLQLTL